MPIRVTCPHCSAEFTVNDSFAGKQGRCPECGEPITVPERPQKRRKSLAGVLAILCVVLLIGGGVLTTTYFNVIRPLAEKARLKELTDNPRVTTANMSLVRSGMTLEEVEGVLGLGAPPTENEVSTSTATLRDSSEAEGRWVPKFRLGHVRRWQNYKDRILVAFSHDPNAGGTVVGVLGEFHHSGVEGFEPTKLPADLNATTPVPLPGEWNLSDLPSRPTLRVTATELASKPLDQYRGAWVSVTGKVKTGMSRPPGGDFVSWEGVTLEQKGPMVRFAEQTGLYPKAPLFAVGDEIEVWGQVSDSPDGDGVLLKNCLLLSPAIEVDTTQLLEEFTKDQKGAEKKYRGKALKVSGVVRKEFALMKLVGGSGDDTVLMYCSGLDGEFKVIPGDRVTILANDLDFYPVNDFRTTRDMSFLFSRLLAVKR